ncbi:MAG TPA: hypothetical protein VLE96_05770 [Chlamydiales bacterium]|nr:hypothetical protein [Chlamydiales bacterium]
MSFSPDASPGSITPGKSIEPAGTSPQPVRDFKPYMEGGGNRAPQGGTPGAQGPTPMSIAQNQNLPGTVPSVDTIAQQAKTMQDSLGAVGQQLKTPNLKLKRSQAHLLKNKLSDAQGYIRQAGAKVGVEAEPLTVPSGTSAIGRFVAYVNDGQNQLIQVQQKLKGMAAKGQQLNAADMLSVTVKMNLAQQEIEYSTTLLAKVIDSVKQIMNIQL